MSPAISVSVTGACFQRNIIVAWASLTRSGELKGCLINALNHVYILKLYVLGIVADLSRSKPQ